MRHGTFPKNLYMELNCVFIHQIRIPISKINIRISYNFLFKKLLSPTVYLISACAFSGVIFCDVCIWCM
jgi:hypothetical protein